MIVNDFFYNIPFAICIKSNLPGGVFVGHVAAVTTSVTIASCRVMALFGNGVYKIYDTVNVTMSILQIGKIFFIN
jgi:hypothetical protein